MPWGHAVFCTVWTDPSWHPSALYLESLILESRGGQLGFWIGVRERPLQRPFGLAGLVDDQGIKSQNKVPIDILAHGAIGATGFDLLDPVGQHHRNVMAQLVFGHPPTNGEALSQEIDDPVVDGVDVGSKLGKIVH